MPAPALLLQDLCKTYDNGFTALHSIDLQVQQGDFFALLGPNGAGKSTTLGIISTLVRKSSGKVEVFGLDLDREPLRAKSLLGIVPQEFNFHSFETVEQTLVQQGPYYGLNGQESRRQAQKYLELLDLGAKSRSRVMDLSGGQKRRLMIARALIHEPKLLFLDEPTAGVDIEIRRSMWSWLRELNQQGTTVVLTTHYLEEAQNLCRNIAIINHGRVIANTSMRELLRRLDRNTFLFEAKNPVSEEQLARLQQSLPFDRKDEHTLRLEVQKEQGLNQVLEQLAAAGLELHYIQPEANQLETLFVKLTQP
ncbi:ABC transporter ATP-binding protein [Candidatus Haliotispira prima]|uniref:ABC transporter ATP-binding protein n=1 Tax=Candidatus Haliotispira prima TaxID=3034016 RepID=A0ABY8MHJ3_9SPIO|nr:ABC transporter ATP-binding protein [Candidatus Haliotispira prima]